MSDMRDFHYLQVVCQDELDGAFTILEQALWDFAADWGLSIETASRATKGGVLSGWTASTVGTGVTVQFTAGKGYDEDGKRITTASTLQLNLGADGQSNPGVGGATNGNSTDPTDGYHRWVTVFLVHDRLLSDPRTDGFNQTVNFKKDESFHFQVDAGAEVLKASTPTKPARRTDAILLGDFRLENTGGTVDCDLVEQDRMEWWLNITGAGLAAKTLQAGDIRSAIAALLDYHSNHVSDTGFQHKGENISHVCSANWNAADPTGDAQAAADVSTGISALINDLAAEGASGGTARIGGRPATGALATTGGGAPPTATDLAADDLHSQLTALLAAVNSRIFRGGDNGITGALRPATDGINLGGASYGWDTYIKTLKRCDAIEVALVPSGSRDLGSASAAWSTLFVDALSNVTGDTDIDVGKNLVPTADGNDLGSASNQWDLHGKQVTCEAVPKMKAAVSVVRTSHAHDLRPDVADASPAWTQGMAGGAMVLCRDADPALSDGLARGPALHLPNGAVVTRLRVAMNVAKAPLTDCYAIYLYSINKSTGAVAAVAGGTISNPSTGYGIVAYTVVAGPTINNGDYVYYLGLEANTTGSGQDLTNLADVAHWVEVQVSTADIRLD